jgi:hypothetical protein
MSYQHKMPNVKRSRQKKVGVYLIRERRREVMGKKMASGMHFVDAAEAAGIPYEVAMGSVAVDEEMRGWWRLSEDRPQVGKSKEMVDRRSPLQIKRDFVNKLAEAGLFDKIPQMVEESDPSTAEGKEMLGFMIKFLIKDILPKEVASKIEHTQKSELTDMSDEELVRLLHERRQARLGAVAERDHADQSRIAYIEGKEEEAQDGESEDMG